MEKNASQLLDVECEQAGHSKISDNESANSNNSR